MNISKDKKIVLVLTAVLLLGTGCSSAVNNKIEEKQVAFDINQQVAANATQQPVVKANQESVVTKNQQPEQIKVKLLISSENDKKEFDYNLAVDATVFELLKKVSADNNFSFKYQESSMGVFVEEIAGVKNDVVSNKYWLYKVNGKFANSGASVNKLKNGDLIEWYYGSATDIKF